MVGVWKAVASKLKARGKNFKERIIRNKKRNKKRDGKKN